jgi:hypothetical protein
MRHALFALAIVLTIIGTAGGAAMLVQHERAAVSQDSLPTAEPKKEQQDASASEPTAEMPVRARKVLRLSKVPHPAAKPGHGKRQPGDDSANELNR